MKKKLHTISIDRVPIRTWSKILACSAFCLISLACCAFCLISLACSAFSFIKIWPEAQFFHLNRDAFDLKFLVLSTNSLVVKMIPTPKLSDHDDIICTKQYLRKCQITNPLSNQTSWDTNRTTLFHSKTVYKKQRTAGECLTQSLQILTWPSIQITLFARTRQSSWLDAVTTSLIRRE